MAVEAKELTCIICPMGCTLNVSLENGKFVSVTGNTCPRGAKYAENEMTAPRRVLTSTIRVVGGHLPLCPVRTKGDIPKEKLFEAMNEINSAQISAPVKIGDILLENVAGTGVSVIATRNIYTK